MGKGPLLKMPNNKMMHKFNLELLRIVVDVTRQILKLDIEQRAALLDALDYVIRTGDLSKMPPDIKLNV